MDSSAGGRRSSERGFPHVPVGWSDSRHGRGSWNGARSAPRYLMDLEIKYRPQGSSEWSEGRTIDISRCGVLFAGAGPPLPATTPVELVIAMPALDTIPGAQVHCSGRIVRVLPQSPVMASTIDVYSFEKPAGHSWAPPPRA